MISLILELMGMKRPDGAHRARAGAVGGGLEHLQTGQRQFVNCSLGILAMVRRRQQAGVLLDHLSTIRTLSSLLLVKIEYLHSTLRL